MARALKIFTVDAFTDVPFAGNPAAVCPLAYDSDLSDDTLLKIAIEMNLSETAYPKLLSSEDSFETSSVFGLRWFTPKDEIKLCGHATLATSVILFNKLGNSSKSITFKTLSGDLIVTKEGDMFRMDFPTGYTEKQDANEYKDLIQSLGDINEVEDVVFCSSLRYLLVRLKDGWTRKQFEKWRPNISQLESSTDKLILVIVTMRGTAEQGFFNTAEGTYDFVSRCFAPWTNVLEDPVTGSAQTVLAHYWANILNKTSFYARQCSARGGEIRITLRDDRVDVFGKGCIVMEGNLFM